MFQNMTIRARLLSLLVFTSALLMFVGGIGLFGMSRAIQGLEEMYHNNTVPIEQLSTIDSHLLENVGLLAAAALNPTNEEIHKALNKIDKNFADSSKLWSEFMATSMGSEEKKLANEFEVKRGNLQKQGQLPMMEMLRAGRIKEATAHFVNVMERLYDESEHAADALIKHQIDAAKEEFHKAESLYNNVRTFAIAAIVIGIALAMFVGIMLTRAIASSLATGVTIANRIAEGNLDNKIEITRNDEVGQLLGALKAMSENLQKIVKDVRESAQATASASEQISAGNTNLSQRTEEQASSLEETASSMEEMTSTVKQNADNAARANQMAEATRAQAEKGGQVVGQAVAAMGEINEASRRIADIITTIDGIAFQTNLLALNAAVEAARAGEQGRGFAVVATEVRNLAQRSANAAKEIKSLIEDSVQKVGAGSKLVEQSGSTLSEIVTSVKKVSDVVADIAAASHEQSSGIDQVNQAVVQMDEMTQQNAALVEEAAAAARSLEEQAQLLTQLMGFFKVGDENRMGMGSRTTVASHATHSASAGGDHHMSSLKSAAAATARMRAKTATAAPKAAPAAAKAPSPSGNGNDHGQWEKF